jgi:hypothetical protein
MTKYIKFYAIAAAILVLPYYKVNQFSTLQHAVDPIQLQVLMLLLVNTGTTNKIVHLTFFW